jgi:hypothetical protein
MVAGHAKLSLSRTSDRFELSLPEKLAGASIEPPRPMTGALLRWRIGGESFNACIWHVVRRESWTGLPASATSSGRMPTSSA